VLPRRAVGVARVVPHFRPALGRGHPHGRRPSGLRAHLPRRVDESPRRTRGLLRARGGAQPARDPRARAVLDDDRAVPRRRGRRQPGAGGLDRPAARPGAPRRALDFPPGGTMAKTDYKNADEYLATFEPGIRKILETVRRTIRSAV